MGRRWVLGVAALVGSLTLMGAPALAADDDDTKAELEALKKRVAELEQKLNANDNSLRQAVERFSGPTSPNDLHAYWDWHDGLKLETADKAFSLHIGGRLQYDFDWFWADTKIENYKAPTMSSALGNQADGDEIRRMRLQMDGTLYADTFFKLEADFSSKLTAVTKTGGTAADVTGGDLVGIRSAYVGTSAFQPYMNIQVGHFTEPFNLETVTSDNFITFMERGLTYTFTPDYQTGIMAYNAIPELDKRVTWAIGEFRPQYGTDNSGSSFQGYEKNNSGYDTTIRVTGLPWYQDDSKGDTFGLLHLGAAVDILTDANPNSPVEFSSAPENHLASAFVDTGAMAKIENYQLYDEEAAFVYGPFSAQSELATANMTRTPGNGKNLSFNAVYAYVSYFLTGEHRGYSLSNGCFDRVKVLHPFGVEKDGHRGWGAWEVALRYSWINLDSQNVYGGKMADVTAGVNWYLNSNVRFMVNYVHSRLYENSGVTGSPGQGGTDDILGVRFQVDF
jgi:phosphate-selective porin OprO/OprP